MIEIPLSRGSVLAPLFTHTQESFVLSFTQGCMGRGWADDPEHPTAARIQVGDFSLLAGDASSPEAPALVKGIEPRASCPVHLVDTENEGWRQLVQSLFASRCTAEDRYAIRKDTVFDSRHLRTLATTLPSEFSIAPIDAGLYRRCLEQPYTYDLVSNFDEADFLHRGVGFCVLRGDEPVGGASSYSIWREGIEIEVDIREDCRRKGLAAAVSATLILDCLKRGLYPSWDAANLASVALAEKLGYRLDHSYTVSVIHRAEKTER